MVIVREEKDTGKFLMGYHGFQTPLNTDSQEAKVIMPTAFYKMYFMTRLR